MSSWPWFILSGAIGWVGGSYTYSQLPPSFKHERPLLAAVIVGGVCDLVLPAEAGGGLFVFCGVLFISALANLPWSWFGVLDARLSVEKPYWPWESPAPSAYEVDLVGGVVRLTPRRSKAKTGPCCPFLARSAGC
jgi:hypothetical protein